jgi:hypothetical protein
VSLNLVASVAVACVAAACGSSKEQTKAPTAEGQGAAVAAGSPSGSEVQEERSASAIVEKIDLNGDRKPDVFKHYQLADEVGADGKSKGQRKVLVRKEIDVNFDQRHDIVEFYRGVSGKEIKEREEYDLDFDGRVDEIRKYKDGNLEEMQLDLGFDGKIDTWKFYQMTKTEDGKDVNRLVEQRRDQNSDGTVETWEYFVNGTLQRIGRDTNGDGQPDQFTRVDEKR